MCRPGPQTRWCWGRTCSKYARLLRLASPPAKFTRWVLGVKPTLFALVFNASAGPAINVSLIDMGNRFRLLVNEVEAVEVIESLPKLPVARALWKPRPNLQTGCAAWLLAGGAHHTAYSQNLTTEQIEDLADLFDVELVVIDQNTNLRQLKPGITLE